VSGAPAPGLQAERTMLAWERTAVGLLATAALLALRSTPSLRAADLAPGALALLLALAIALIGRLRARRIVSGSDHVPAAGGFVLLAGGGVAVLGLLTLAVTLSAPAACP
jgi:putative membrane protein